MSLADANKKLDDLVKSFGEQQELFKVMIERVNALEVRVSSPRPACSS